MGCVGFDHPPQYFYQRADWIRVRKTLACVLASIHVWGMSDVSKLNGPTIWQVPEGDNRERLTCPDCGFINYENPKIVVGAVCAWEGKLLLCRRAIEPRRGFGLFPPDTWS